MSRWHMWLALKLPALAVTPASAQEPGLDLPQPEHRLLGRPAGGWEFERLSVPADGSTPQTLGYDVGEAEDSGQWIDSFMSFRWELAGFVDEGTQERVLTTRGPAPGGGDALFRERYRLHSGDFISIQGELQRSGGWCSSRRPTPPLRTLPCPRPT